MWNASYKGAHSLHYTSILVRVDSEKYSSGRRGAPAKGVGR